ncbi:MAG: hypothetical protein D6737_09015 [Chloroflexi bacterium]|nr:MAG: hypothetical protein D6737_09015 [Chloroflexota bacterium]
MSKQQIITIILISLVLMSISIIAFAQETTITFDQVVTGEITNDNPAVRYQFQGTAGDVISISMTATQQGLDSYLNLLDANGNVIFRDDDSGGNLNSLLGPFTLPADGVYTIEATRCCPPVGPQGSTGPYELRLMRTKLNVVSLDERITVDLTDAESSVAFALDADSVGDVLRIAASKIAGDADFFIEVRDPQGMNINGGGTFGEMTQFTVEPIIINQSGRYLINIRRQSTDQFGAPETDSVRLSFIVSQPTIQPLQLGETVSGVIDDQNPSAYYAFNATASDLLRMTGAETVGSQAFEVVLYGPDGFSITGAATPFTDTPGQFTVDPVQIFEGGQHLAIVRRISVEGPVVSGVSEYTFTISPSQTAFLQPGIEITDTVGGDQNFEKVFRFDGVEGQTIRITLRSVNNNYAPGLNVQGPGNGMPGFEPAFDMGMGGGGDSSFIVGMNGGIPATATYEVTLPATGTYLFRVNNGMFSPSGPLSGMFGLLVEVL